MPFFYSENSAEHIIRSFIDCVLALLIIVGVYEAMMKQIMFWHRNTKKAIYQKLCRNQDTTTSFPQYS